MYHLSTNLLCLLRGAQGSRPGTRLPLSEHTCPLVLKDMKNLYPIPLTATRTIAPDSGDFSSSPPLAFCLYRLEVGLCWVKVEGS